MLVNQCWTGLDCLSVIVARPDVTLPRWRTQVDHNWCKGAIWEQTTHIPFIVRGPNIKTGSICTQPVSLIDVYPSLVDFAGFKIPDYLNGKSIKPQLANPATPRHS